MVAIPISDLVAASNNNINASDQLLPNNDSLALNDTNVNVVSPGTTGKIVPDSSNSSLKQSSNSTTPTLPSKQGFAIYKAKYSNVDVYELAHPTGSIMKRKVDDWVNATHILKAANFAKAKRTRILEKDVMGEEHEKVQGGFGKYQGTWVPLSLAITLSKKYNVYDELESLLTFVVKEGEPEPEPAPKHTHASKKSDGTKAKKEVSTKKKAKNGEEIGTLVFNDKKVKKPSKKELANGAAVNIVRKETTKQKNKETQPESLASASSFVINRGVVPNMTDLSLISQSQLLGLKRAHSDLDYIQDTQQTDQSLNNGMISVSSGHNGNNGKYRQPVKLQRQSTNKGLILGNDYASQNHSQASNILYSPVSGTQMMMGMMSPFGSQHQIYTRSYSNTGTTAAPTSGHNNPAGSSQMKLPSLVAAANVALSPSFNGNKQNGNLQVNRPASRMNSGQYKSGYTTIDEPSQNSMSSLLPSLTTLSTQKNPQLQTPRVSSNNNTTSSIRKTPIKPSMANSGTEPMTPFYSNKHISRSINTSGLKKHNSNGNNGPVVVTLSRNNSISNQRTQLPRSENMNKSFFKEDSDDAEIEIKFGNVLVNHIIMAILVNKEDELNTFVDTLNDYDNKVIEFGELIKYGIDNEQDVKDFKKSFIINSRIDIEGDTLLHLACGIGNCKLIQYILNKCEVNIWKLNVQGETSFMQMFKFKNCMMKNELVLDILKIFRTWFLDNDNLTNFNKFLSFQNYKNENIIHLILKFKCNLKKSVDNDLETKNIIEARFHIVLEETLKFLDKFSLTKMLIRDQDNQNGNTPIHIALLVIQEDKVYDKMINILKLKYLDDAHTFKKIMDSDMKQVLNKHGEIMYNEKLAEFKKNECNMANYNKMYEKINIRIIPKIRELLMDTLNKTYMNQELMSMEEVKNKELRMKIEEMKMMLDMKILDDFIYEKKLEEKKIFGIDSGESSNDNGDKLKKIKEIRRLIDDNIKKTIEYYNKTDEENVLDYRKIVSKYMDVEIEQVDIAMIDKMLEELN